MRETKKNKDLEIYEQKTLDFLWEQGIGNAWEKKEGKGFTEEQRKAIMKILAPIENTKIRYLKNCQKKAN